MIGRPHTCIDQCQMQAMHVGRPQQLGLAQSTQKAQVSPTSNRPCIPQGIHASDTQHAHPAACNYVEANEPKYNPPMPHFVAFSPKASGGRRGPGVSALPQIRGSNCTAAHQASCQHTLTSAPYDDMLAHDMFTCGVNDKTNSIPTRQKLTSTTGLIVSFRTST